MTQPRTAPAGYDWPGPDKEGIWLEWDGKETATTGWLVIDNTGPGQEILCEVPYLLYATRIVDALLAALAKREGMADRTEVRPTREQAAQLASYATHYGNCSLDSWNKAMTKCDCGLFALLAEIGFKAPKVGELLAKREGKDGT